VHRIAESRAHPARTELARAFSPPRTRAASVAIHHQELAMSFRRLVRCTAPAAALLASLSLAAACGSDNSPTAPTRDQVVGSYAATTFTAALGGFSQDVLAAGGSVTLALTSDGNATARVVIPAALAGGTTFDETLTGTWALSGNTVTLDDPNNTSDTFLENLQLKASGNTLVGDGTFAGVVVHLVLTRSS